MNTISILCIFIGTLSDTVITQWVDFIRPSEYANMTLKQQHTFLLQRLVYKDDQFLATAFHLEMFARSIGNYFYRFPIDKNLTKENNAIIKATLECFKRLLVQDKIESMLKMGFYNAVRYVRTYGSYSLAFSLMCSDFDFYLKNETLYVTLKKEFEKQCHSRPNKIYHYGIGKTIEDEYGSVEKLFNEPKMKPLMAHLAWIWMTNSFNSTLRDMKNSIIKLAKVPDNFETIQKNYDQTIKEIIPQLKRIDIFFIRPESKEAYFSYLQSNLTERLWSKIIQDIPDWKDYLECDPVNDANVPDTSAAQSKLRKSGRCGRTKVTPVSIFKAAWPVISDFNSSELVNLTLEQQHELFVKELPKNKNQTFLQNIILLELLAKNAGNDFFSLETDEKLNDRNNAIVKAAFDCCSNLQIQLYMRNMIDLATFYAAQYVTKNDDIRDGFNQLCVTIDKTFENETIYTTKRDEYMKQNSSAPKKIYQYSIGKPTDDQRKIAAELVNEPLVKKIWLNFLWMRVNGTVNPLNELQRTKYTILELAKVPSKTEAVQQIYEQSVNETIPFFKDFTHDKIFHPDSFLVRLEVSDIFTYVSLLMRQIVFNIKKSPDDLVTAFEAIVEQSRPKKES